jgi:hypothetical protein
VAGGFSSAQAPKARKPSRALQGLVAERNLTVSSSWKLLGYGVLGEA